MQGVGGMPACSSVRFICLMLLRIFDDFRKLLPNLVRFLKADHTGSESLYQMIGFIGAVSRQWYKVYLKSIAAVSGARA